MATSHQTGKQGEAVAVEHLAGQGYEILEKNWQSNHQEIDIIARKENTLVITEVKSRSSNYFGEPEIFVTKPKQRLLIKAANHYITKNNLDVEVRFDIISVLFNKDQHKLKHIEDAFYPLI
jgi:putative endonuclease